MTELTVTKTRFFAGVWEGVVGALDADAPEIDVSHLGKVLDDVSLSRNDSAGSQWNLRIPVPVELLGDGVQVFVITDRGTGEKLNGFTIISGEPLEDDIRSDVELLRAELDMLKRAFRRHCLENH